MTDSIPTRPARRRSPVYSAVVLFYLLLFLAVMWPVYPRFSSIAPRVLGMPFSLVYVVGVLILSFSGLLGLYLWEGAGRPEAPEVDGETGC